MRLHVALAGILGVVIGTGLSLRADVPRPRRPAPSPSWGRFEGTITSVGQPAQGALVVVQGEWPFTDDQVQTDARGFYRTVPLPKGLYRIEASLGGRVVASSQPLRLVDGQVTRWDAALPPSSPPVKAAPAPALSPSPAPPSSAPPSVPPAQAVPEPPSPNPRPTWSACTVVDWFREGSQTVLMLRSNDARTSYHVDQEGAILDATEGGWELLAQGAFRITRVLGEGRYVARTDARMLRGHRACQVKPLPHP